MPAFSFIFGNVIDIIGKDEGDVMAQITDQVLVMVGVAAGLFIVTSLWHFSLSLVSSNIGKRVRVEYMKNLLRKDISWYDLRSPAELPVKIESNMTKIQDAIGFKAGTFITNVSQLLVAYAIGFWRGWHVALTVFATVPVIAISAITLGKIGATYSTTLTQIYAKSGAIVEEVMSAIRTVTSFNGQAREIKRYGDSLTTVRSSSIQLGFRTALVLGITLSIFQFTFALAFYVGGELTMNGVVNPSTGSAYTGGDILTIIFCVMIGTFGIGQAATYVGTYADGLVACKDFYELIDEKSKIENPWASEQVEKIKVESLALKSVSFNYPSRPDQTVLKDVSLTIKAGQKIALVGPSGSGKSTILALLERFYDPASGAALLNGRDIKSVSVKSLRNCFAYVGQEPVLFGTSIRENLIYGIDAALIPSNDDLEKVCEEANILDFIKSLPLGFETFCGPGGSQVSGGQKQRIAIARALLRQAPVLLLDEATSALDTESEKLVQATLDKAVASRSLTTICVAHRLSTIRNSDVIFVLENGNLVEQGTHATLMEKRKTYFALVSSQEAAEKLTDEKMSMRKGAVKAEDVRVETTEPTSPRIDEEAAERLREAAVLKNYNIPLSRFFRFSKGDSLLYVIGFLGAAGKGISQPLQGYLLAQSMGSFYLNYTAESQLESIKTTCLLFVYLGIGVLFAMFFEIFMFSVIGAKFAYRVRRDTFSSLLRKDICYFDIPENAPAVLGDTLYSKTTQMSAISGQSLGIFLEMISAIVAGLSIGFTGCPELAAVILGMTPLISLAQMTQAKYAMGMSKSTSSPKKQATRFLSESVQNMRTLKSFRAERWAQEIFEGYVVASIGDNVKECIVGGLSFGVSFGFIFCVYAVGFYFGGWLVVNNGVSVTSFTQGLMGVMTAAAGAGQALVFLPDMNKAKIAAHDVFAILDNDPKIADGPKSANAADVISFENVWFSYPNRPEVRILKGLSFSVKAGQRVALVGPSGGGKSTIMALLQRFYEPSEGSISINGQDIRELKLDSLRSLFGYVIQEPVLFDSSLQDNLTYGDALASPEKVKDACKQANLDDFVPSNIKLDDGVGPKGSLLSGGQKQRVAIARALVKDPKVLLLDEATSALDSANEKIVQAAIDKVSIGKTSFVIAHRLQTIEDADLIIVISDGVASESGTHAELMARKSVYYNLVVKGQQ